MGKAKAAGSMTRLMRTTSSTCAAPGNEPVAISPPQPDATTNHKILSLHYALTTSFSSEDGWRGACASRRRDRRLRLLQALVRFAAQAWTRCRSAFLQDIQPRHRARPEPQPTKLVLLNCTAPAHDSTAPARREASEFGSGAARGQGPTCAGAAIERQSRPWELSRLRSRADSRP